MWQSRIYRFLFQRILGPYLTKKSREKLSSLDISLRQGLLILHDIELDGCALQKKINLDCKIEQVLVKRLELQLAIIYEDEFGQQVQGYADGSARLVAQLKMDGIDVIISSFENTNRSRTAGKQKEEKCSNSSREQEVSVQDVPSSKSTFQTYIKAIADSLKLSVNIQNISIQLNSPQDKLFLALNIESLSFQENDKECSKGESNYILVLDTLTVLTGMLTDAYDVVNQQELLRMDGCCTVLYKKSKEKKLINVTLEPIQASCSFESVSRTSKILNSFASHSAHSVDDNDKTGQVVINTKSESILDNIELLNDQKSTENVGLMAHIIQHPSSGLEYMDKKCRSSQTQDISEEDVAYQESDFESIMEKDLLDLAEDDEFSQFKQKVEDSILNETSYMNDFTRNECNCSTEIELAMEEIIISFDLNGCTSKNENKEGTQYLLVKLQSIEISSRTSENQHHLAFDVTDFDIEFCSYDEDYVNDPVSLLNFHGVDDYKESLISMTIDINVGDDDLNTRVIAISLVPFQFIYYDTIVSKIMDGISSKSEEEVMMHPNETPTQIHSTNGSLSNTTLMCEQISIYVPFFLDPSQNKDCFKDLSRRCGYSSKNKLKVGDFGLNLSMYEVSVKLDQHEAEKTSSIMCNRILVSVSGVDHRVIDVLSFDGEEKIDPDAVIKIVHSETLLSNKTDAFKASRVKSSFPYVETLESIKASQKDKTDSNTYEELPFTKRTIRASNPEEYLIQDSMNCEKIFHISIPSVSLDVSTKEASILVDLFTCCQMSDREKDAQEVKQGKGANQMNIIITCNQITFCFHEDVYSKTEEMYFYTYMLVFDDFRSHLLLDSQGLKNIRILSNDLSLFEVKNGVEGYIEKLSMSERQMVDLRKRRLSNKFYTSPIFFRSKIGRPLSPSTPALTLDILIRNDDAHTERSIYISIYDMTHRHYYDLEWVSRLQTISTHFYRQGKNEEESCSSSCINNVFFTMNDCNIDYTSAESFSVASRSILRLGEIRFTSNIISPPSPMNVMKVTLGDLSIFILNKRLKHDNENQQLTCSNALFPSSDHFVAQKTTKVSSFEHNLSKLSFVQVVTLDCIEASIINDLHFKGLKSNMPAAQRTLELNFGHARIYSCRDTFACFTDTINDLLTFMTMPSVEELKQMADDYFAGQENTADDSKVPEDVDNSILDPQTVFTHAALSLDDVIENGLFSSTIIEEDLVLDNELAMIPDFFEITEEDVANHNTQCLNQFQDHDDEDWTQIDHSWDLPRDEEQTSGWFSGQCPTPMTLNPNLPRSSNNSSCTVVPEHIPIDTCENKLYEGDMGVSKLLGTDKKLSVTTRIIITDMKLDCRFFAGNDWSASIEQRKGSSHLNALLQGGNNINNDDIFKPDPGYPRHSRHSDQFFQLSFSGLKLRLDSFSSSLEQRLASSTDISLNEFFILETVSGKAPVKLMGEWVNAEHPRDRDEGQFMMKMMSMEPKERFSLDGQFMGNETRVTLELLPIRFFIHQVALRFIRNFFHRSEDQCLNEAEKCGNNYANPPDVFFPIFKVNPVNVKVDYKPKEVNTSALFQDGSLIELLNVLPLEDMILRLSEVEMTNATGWGAAISELVCSWLQDVSSTQIHKFLTRTTPLHPFATVGDGVKQFVMIPLDEYKQKGSMRKGLKKGSKQLANVLAYETLGVGAKLTNFAAKRLGKKKKISKLPKTINEVSDHAMESVARGLKEANAKMIIIPYREYQQSGTKKAVKSVVRGIPVAVCAPLSGAAEAVSYGLLGARNQLRPDLREEEEVSKNLHDNDGLF